MLIWTLAFIFIWNKQSHYLVTSAKQWCIWHLPYAWNWACHWGQKRNKLCCSPQEGMGYKEGVSVWGCECVCMYCMVWFCVHVEMSVCGCERMWLSCENVYMCVNVCEYMSVMYVSRYMWAIACDCACACTHTCVWKHKEASTGLGRVPGSVSGVSHVAGSGVVPAGCWGSSV